MNTLFRYFLQGLLILVPIALTVYVVFFLVSTVDSWLGIPIPGVGLVLTLLLITVIGFLASNVVGAKVFKLIEHGLTHVPGVKLLYSSLRDLLNAFVGEKRTFDRPVMVSISEDPAIQLLGFITSDTLADARLIGHVAVYIPQAYNFAGNLLIVPRERVQTIDADGARFMAFIVSGGIAELSGAKTAVDLPTFK